MVDSAFALQKKSIKIVYRTFWPSFKFKGINKDGDHIKITRPGHNSGMHDSMLVIFKKLQGS